MIYEVRLGGETAKGLVVAAAVAGGEYGAAWKSRRVAVVRRCLSLLLSMGRWTAVAAVDDCCLLAGKVT
jgi:hypothetical protein